MDYKIYKEENFKASNWTGGKTKQLAIFPEKGNYLERNFIWRLSSATCEREESNFSKLPDFDRVLVVLEGKTVLAHQDVRAARLDELEQDRFDGAYNTKSFGKITDYNLILAKGNQGFLDVITPDAESCTPEIEDYPEYERATQAYYCRDGFATVTINGQTIMISPGQQLVVNYDQREKVTISVMGEGHLVRAQIFYHYRPDETGPVEIPREKATFDDFKTCVYLANTQFRGARFVFKKLKTQWLDEELSKGIKKIERLYIPFFVLTLGIVIIASIGLTAFEVTTCLGLIAAWILLDIFIVSPLIYFSVLPKPVRKHIKDINHLTPYEEKVLEKQMATNERLERLLKKYKNSGKILYDEEESHIDEM